MGWWPLECNQKTLSGGGGINFVIIIFKKDKIRTTLNILMQRRVEEKLDCIRGRGRKVKRIPYINSGDVFISTR